MAHAGAGIGVFREIVLDPPEKIPGQTSHHKSESPISLLT
jgi:hypothetical protein